MVRATGRLVTEPESLLTITRKLVPCAPGVGATKVSVRLVAPANWEPLAHHWYSRGGRPRAATENRAWLVPPGTLPSRTVWSAGCSMIVGRPGGSAWPAPEISTRTPEIPAPVRFSTKSIVFHPALKPLVREKGAT